MAQNKLAHAEVTMKDSLTRVAEQVSTELRSNFDQERSQLLQELSLEYEQEKVELQQQHEGTFSNPCIYSIAVELLEHIINSLLFLLDSTQ